MSNNGEINDEKINKNEIDGNTIELIANFINIFGDENLFNDFKVYALASIIAVREKLDKIGNLIADEKISKEEFAEIKEPLIELNEKLAKFYIKIKEK